MINHSHRMGPQVGDLEDRGDGVAGENVWDRMTTDPAFGANSICGFSDSHLIVFHEVAVPRAELREGATLEA